MKVLFTNTLIRGSLFPLGFVIFHVSMIHGQSPSETSNFPDWANEIFQKWEPIAQENSDHTLSTLDTIINSAEILSPKDLHEIQVLSEELTINSSDAIEISQHSQIPSMVSSDSSNHEQSAFPSSSIKANINLGQMNFFVDAIKYVNGGVTLHFPENLFTQTPFIQVSVVYNKSQNCKNLNLSNIVQHCCAKSITIRINKEYRGILFNDVIDADTDGFVVHVWALGI